MLNKTEEREKGCHHMSEFQTSHLFATVCPRLPEDREGRGSVRSASKTDSQRNTHSTTSGTSVNTNTDLTLDADGHKKA